MKLQYIFIATTVATTISLACSEQESMNTPIAQKVEVTIVASTPQSTTRVSYDEDENKTLIFSWDKGDSFSIFEGDTQQTPASFTTTNGDGQFAGELNSTVVDDEKLYGVYPSTSGVQSPLAISHTIADQTLKDGRLDLSSNSNFIYASGQYNATAATSFAFNNTMSMLKLEVELPNSISATSISYASFGSTSLITSATIDITKSIPTWSPSAWGNITLSTGAIIATNNVIELWIVLFPQELEDLSIQLYDANDNLLCGALIEGDVELEVGKWYEDAIITEANNFDTSLGDTPANPMVISSATDLCALAAYYNSGETIKGKYIELTQNIDLKGINFTPIGNSSDCAFTGNFDGGGYRIENLTIDQENLLWGGLFGVVASGSLKDLTVSGSINTTLSSDSSNSLTAKIGGIFGESIYTNNSGNYFIVSGDVVSEVEIYINSTSDDGLALNVGGIAGCVAGATSDYSEGFFIADGTNLIYGKSAESKTTNDEKTMAGMVIKGGNDNIFVGGIFGVCTAIFYNYDDSATLSTFTTNVYAKRIEVEAQSGSGTSVNNLALGGIYGKIWVGHQNLSNQTAKLTADLEAIYSGTNNDNRNLLVGGFAGWVCASQAPSVGSTMENITLRATSASSNGILSVSMGTSASGNGTVNVPTSGNYKRGTEVGSVTYYAAGGASQYINLTLQ